MSTVIGQSNLYRSHETRNGALCGDLFATTGSPLYVRDAEQRVDRIYHLCAFGECSNPRLEWVNVRNLRERKQ